MKFTQKQILQVLRHCGVAPSKGNPDPSAPLVKIITAAMESQNDEKGEPLTADNQLANEISLLNDARAYIEKLEEGK